MKKKFKLSIDIDANIIEQITPELIEKRIAEDYEGEIHIPQDVLEKFQVVLSYILHNENYFLDILVGDLLECQTNYGGETELGKYFRPKIFEDICLAIGKEMGPDYEAFIKDLVNLQISVAAKNLYKVKKKCLAKGNDMERTYDFMVETLTDAQIGTDGQAPELKVEDEIVEPELISECLMLLLMDCLLNYKITGASLKEIKKGSQTP